MTKKIILKFTEKPANKASISARKKVFNIGVNDSNYITEYKEDGKRFRCKYYTVWSAMIRRCYDNNFHKRQPKYKNCTVAKEWHLFSNFKKWMERQDWKGKELDKDILIIGNTIYNSKNCVFVDKKINCLLIRSSSDHSGLIFIKSINKYQVQVSINGKSKAFGCYKSKEKASNIYKELKSKEIKRIADLQEYNIKKGLYRHAEAILNGRRNTR